MTTPPNGPPPARAGPFPRQFVLTLIDGLGNPPPGTSTRGTTVMANQHRDTIVIGAGPAGLQLAYFLEKAGRDYLVVDGADRAGAYFAQYPRHRKLLSINKQYTGREATEFNLRHDWNCLLTHPGDEMPFKEFSTDYFP